MRRGVVTRVDADHIEIGSDVYKMRKFRGPPTNEPARTKSRSSESATRSKRAKSSPTAAATHKGELALGRNVLAAFMAWDGRIPISAMVLNPRWSGLEMATTLSKPISTNGYIAGGSCPGDFELPGNLSKGRAPILPHRIQDVLVNLIQRTDLLCNGFSAHGLFYTDFA